MIILTKGESMLPTLQENEKYEIDKAKMDTLKAVSYTHLFLSVHPAPIPGSLSGHTFPQVCPFKLQNGIAV